MRKSEVKVEVVGREEEAARFLALVDVVERIASTVRSDDRRPRRRRRRRVVFVLRRRCRKACSPRNGVGRRGGRKLRRRG